MATPGLVLTGKCYGRNVTGRPYVMDDGRSGVSYKVRFGLGGGEYLDVKIKDDAALLAQMPTTEDVGTDGIDMAIVCYLSYGKLVFESVVPEGSRAVRSA